MIVEELNQRNSIPFFCLSVTNRKFAGTFSLPMPFGISGNKKFGSHEFLEEKSERQ